MNEEQPVQPIPYTATEPMDLQKMVSDMPGSQPIPLRDVNREFNIVGCIVCSRGGHTGHTLFSVIEDIATGKQAKACQEHVHQFIRPRDLRSR